METTPNKVPLREKLLQAGVEELYLHGFDHFSVRRIASQCGVSCAAPYKHFADKPAFIDAIFDHVNEQWMQRQRQTCDACGSDIRQTLLAVSESYIRFLVENPHFRAILMTRHEPHGSACGAQRTRLNAQMMDLVAAYLVEHPMEKAVQHRKLFIARSLVYGAALLFDNGDLAYNEENMQMVMASIEREFDLP